MIKKNNILCYGGSEKIIKRMDMNNNISLISHLNGHTNYINNLLNIDDINFISG